MSRVGDTVRINGMKHTVTDVKLQFNAPPIFFLQRHFDGSMWYAQCRFVTRFTHIKRVFDSAHANLDHASATALLDAAMHA